MSNRSRKDRSRVHRPRSTGAREYAPPMTTAWLAGGSGLVGGVLLRRLLDDALFSRVISVGRRRLALEHPKLTQVVVDFSSASAFEPLEPPAAAFRSEEHTSELQSP